MKRTVFGTSWFPTMQDAYEYYKEYGYNHVGVTRKIAEGEISIGEPAKFPHEVARYVKDRRWHIETV